MKRHTCQPRTGWQQTVEAQGLLYAVTYDDQDEHYSYWDESTYYEFSLDEVERLEDQVAELHELALDAVALLSFLIVQLLDAPMPVAWLVATVLAGLAAPGLLRLADKVFAMARNGATVPRAGESFL